MGTFLFKSTNRANGIVCLCLCVGVVVVGMWETFSGNYFGAILIPLGAIAGKFCLQLATQCTELYEHGFVSKNIFKSVSARYADLKSIGRTAVIRNGVTNTLVVFATKSGQRVVVHTEKFLKQDDRMNLLLERSTSDLAEVWAKTLDRQTEITWLREGKTVLKIRKDGLLVEGKGSQTFVSLAQFKATSIGGLTFRIFNSDQKVLDLNFAFPNFYVGLALIGMLSSKQKSMAASASN